MRNIKDYNKSLCFNFQQSPRFNNEKKKLFDPYSSKIDEGSSKHTFKNKLKQLEKDKFSNIPKNENLMNYSTILHKKSHENNKDQNYYINLLNNIYQQEQHLDNTNIKKKLNENLKISSIIPVSRKMVDQTKEKIKEEKNKDDFLKKNNRKNSRRRTSFNDLTKFHRKNSKRLTKNSFSSLNFLNAKKRNSQSLRRMSEIGKVLEYLKEEEKVKKYKKEKEGNDNDNNNENKNGNNDKENKEENKK